MKMNEIDHSAVKIGIIRQYFKELISTDLNYFRFLKVKIIDCLHLLNPALYSGF